MERIQKYYGALIINNGRIFDIEGGQTGQGEVYKDFEAFDALYSDKPLERQIPICYASEADLNRIKEQLAEAQAIYENTKPGEPGYMTDEEYEIFREQIILNGCESRTTIMQQVSDAYGEEYMLTFEQALHFAREILEDADWACISTYLSEYLPMDDSILADEDLDRHIFNDFQHKAVREGMTPREFYSKMHKVAGDIYLHPSSSTP